MTNSFRTNHTQKVYDDFISQGGLDAGCRLCVSQSLEEFKHWRIIENAYPYDRVAAKHTMLLPKRHTIETELNAEEKAELLNIKHSGVVHEYDFVMQATARSSSIPEHFHLHLIAKKDFLD